MKGWYESLELIDKIGFGIAIIMLFLILVL